MRADGTGQHRLTTSTESDSGPSWSPDGTQIMFTRSSGDSMDLYVMNTDGSAVERLTRNGESADGSWSPDGERIVFWSKRDFVSGLYVMDVDGSDVRFLTEEFDTAWGADWSPDGETIVFVGSKDDPTTGDEVVAIYRMNADGSGQEEVARPTGYWIDEPEWSPDGESIAFFSDGHGPGALWVMNADGTQQRAITTTGDSHAPSWRP
jgi:TolB protein